MKLFVLLASLLVSQVAYGQIIVIPNDNPAVQKATTPQQAPADPAQAPQQREAADVCADGSCGVSRGLVVFSGVRSWASGRIVSRPVMLRGRFRIRSN